MKAVTGAPGEEAGGPEAGVPTARAALEPAIAAVHHRAASARKHAAPGVSVASAQAAALSPKVEQQRAAATQTVAALDAAKAEEVKRNEFKAKLRKAVEEATPKPKTEAEAEKVMKTGAAQASVALRGHLATERDAAAGPMKSAVATEVPPSSQPAPPAATLQSEPVGPPPAPVSAAPVVPAPCRWNASIIQRIVAPPTRSWRRTMSPRNRCSRPTTRPSDRLSRPVLRRRSTRPLPRPVTARAKAKSRARHRSRRRRHCPRIWRASMASANTRSGRSSPSSSEPRERMRRAATHHRHHHRHQEQDRADVEAILSSMEAEAGKIFEDGLQRAEKAYEDAFEEAKGGIGTWLTTWGSDWDKHIEKALATARSRYLQEVDTAIDQVATFVEGKLKAAKQRVADGRKEVETFVSGLDASVKQHGEDALQAVSADFDTMGSEIDQRRDGLINTLTDQYKASYEPHVRHGGQAPRGEQVALAACLRSDGRPHQQTDRVQEHADGRPGAGGRRSRADLQGPDRFLPQPGQRGQAGVPELRRQDRVLPRTGPDGLALRSPRGRGDRIAQVVRPEGHPAPRPPGAWPDLRQHPCPGGESLGREGRRGHRDHRRDLQEADHRRPGGSGSGSRRRSAT